MSTSLLYHGWGLRCYRHRRSEFGDGAIQLVIERAPDKLRCSRCGSDDVIRAGQAPRRFRGLPIGGRPIWIALAVQRLSCRACGCTRQANLGFADPRLSYTRAFERYALELSWHMTIFAVAQHLRVGRDMIKDMQKRHLTRRFKRIRLKKLRRIAIAEISIGKGHRYFTVVLDLSSGAVVFIGDGKGAKSLDSFWKRLRASGAKVKAVATDMSPAYTLAVREHLPKAVHVFDRFHVVKLFNDKLSDLRRHVQSSAQTIEQKQVIKGTRWLLLKNPQNLDDDRDERARLNEALRLNQPLAAAYYLKEDLRQLVLNYGNQLIAVLADHGAEVRVEVEDHFARRRAQQAGGVVRPVELDSIVTENRIDRHDRIDARRAQQARQRERVGAIEPQGNRI